ncbi:KGG domain-containing protein [Pseudoduganella sp. UC29_71]|uniref:KGG domain-containing protein n=1 Tax=Pseudoduganella sp. UC29_71 TaxID=3350174 RepID=UPI00366D88B7
MASSNQGKDQDNKGSQGSNQGSKQSSSQSSKQSGDTSNRGFASMDPERQREIAAEGGRAAHEKGTAHEFTSEEARRAGSMSHKNDQSSQSSSGSSGSRSGSGGGNEGSNQGGGSRGGSGGSGGNR